VTRPLEQTFHDSAGRIVGLTVIGRTTVELLQMNTPDRIELRLALLTAGLWDPI
jgi:hypothetical protein